MVVKKLKYQSTTGYAVIKAHQVDVDKIKIIRNEKKTQLVSLS